jgi:hypothetical protein
MPLWENYVTRTVEHYKDRIRYWEICNEPYWTSFFAGTPQQCTEYLAVAYRAIKRAQPEAIVLGGWPRGDTDTDPWNSDTTKRCGPAVPPALPREGFALDGVEAAGGFVKGVAEMLSEGSVITCYYYTAKASPWFSSTANSHYGLLDYDGRPKPTMMAYSAMELLLDGARYVRLVERDGLTIHVFGKMSKGCPGTVAVVWSDRRRPISPRGATLLDMMGNEMTELVLRPDEPAYVCAPAIAPNQFERVLP